MNVLLLVVLTPFLVIAPPRGEPARPRVLVFTRTAGFHHDAIPAGIAAVRELGADGGFAVDATEDAAAFTRENLARYRAIVFLNTSGEVLRRAAEGGVPGVHPGRRRAGGRPPGGHHARQVAVVRRAGRRREVRRTPAGPEGDLPLRDSRSPGHEDPCPTPGSGPTSGTTTNRIPRPRSPRPDDG